MDIIGGDFTLLSFILRFEKDQCLCMRLHEDFGIYTTSWIMLTLPRMDHNAFLDYLSIFYTFLSSLVLTLKRHFELCFNVCSLDF